MNELLKFAINFFALIIICTVIEQLTINDKMALYIKPAIYAVIIIHTVTFFSKISFSDPSEFLIEQYTVDSDAVWNSACENSEITLKEHMLDICSNDGLDVDDIYVDLETDMESFYINRVIIYGEDADTAKNLICGYYGISDKSVYTEG